MTAVTDPEIGLKRQPLEMGSLSREGLISNLEQHIWSFGWKSVNTKSPSTYKCHSKYNGTK